jgi:translocation and assembly module TamB
MAGRWRSAIVWMLRLSLGMVVAVVLAGLAAVGLLQTEVGQRQAAALLAQGLSQAQGAPVRIDALGPGFPGRIDLFGVTIEDGSGPWLTARAFALHWKPAALLKGEVRASRLAADGLYVLRRPAPRADDAVEAPPQPFTIPQVPFAVRVEQIAVTDLRLDAAVLGEAVRLDITSSLAAAAEGGVVDTALVVNRTDGGDSRVALEARWLPETGRLSLDLAVNEETARFLHGLLGLPGTGPLAFRLKGEGPDDGWRGTLAVTLGGAQVEGTVGATWADDPTIALDGTATVADLVPEAARPILSPHLAYAIGVTLKPDDVLAIDRLRLKAAAADLEVSGEGQFDLARSTIDGTLTAAVLPPPRLTAPLRVGRVDLKARIAGALTSPGLDALGTLAGIAGDGFGIETLALSLGARPAAGDGIDVTLDGEARAIAMGQGTLARLLGDTATIGASGRYGLADGGASLERLKLRFGALAAEARGAWSASGGQGEASVKAAFALTDRAVADPLIQALAGSQPTAQVELLYNRDDGLRFDRLLVAGRGLRGEGQGRLSADGGTVAADLMAEIPDLAPVGTALGTPLQGAASLRVLLSGSAGDPLAEGRLEAVRLTTPAGPVPRAVLEVRARSLATSPSGNLDVRLETAAGPAVAASSFAMDGFRAVLLPDLSLAWSGLSGSGTLGLPMGDGPLAGTLNLRLDPESPGLPLSAYRLSGDATARIDLAGTGAEPGLTLDLAAARLRLAQSGMAVARIGRLDLDATVGGPPALPRVTARIGAQGLGPGPEGTLLDRFDLEASGTARAAQFTLSLVTEPERATRIAAAGRLAVDGGATTVSIETLTGQAGDAPLALARPARVTIAGPRTTLDGLDLGIGTGRLAAAGTLGGDGTSGSVTLDRLPLDLAHVLVPGVAPAGTLSGQALLRTDRGLLSGRAALDLDAVTPSPARGVPASALTGRLAATWSEGVINADGRIGGEGDDRVALSARIPLAIDGRSLEPIPGAPPSDLDGAATWDIRLQSIARLLALDGHLVSGRTRGDLKAKGPLAGPAVAGTFAIEASRYENLLTGTILRDLDLDGAVEGSGGDGSAAVTVEIRGTDGGDGRISGGGTLRRDPRQGMGADLALGFERMALVRRDDVTLIASGPVTFRGPLDAGRLEAEMRTDRVLVSLAERLPPSVIVLPVTEVPPAPGADAAGGGTGEGWDGTIDLRVLMPNRVFVRGRGVESEWSGDMLARGRGTDPAVSGVVTLIRGFYAFAGKRFELTKGVIRIAGKNPDDVALDLEAQHRAAALTAFIRVGGTVAEPEIRLVSQPSFPESEILAQVMFNRSATWLGPVEAAQVGQALASLAGGGSVADDMLSSVRAFLGLDVLTVGDDPAGTGSPTLGAGRYLGERIYIEGRQGTAAGTGAGALSIEILPGLSLESEVEQAEEGPAGSIGLRWKLDY